SDQGSPCRSGSSAVPLPLTLCCLSRRASSSWPMRSDLSTCPTNLICPPPPLGSVWAVDSLSCASSGGGSFSESRASSSSQVMSPAANASSDSASLIGFLLSLAALSCLNRVVSSIAISLSSDQH